MATDNRTLVQRAEDRRQALLWMENELTNGASEWAAAERRKAEAAGVGWSAWDDSLHTTLSRGVDACGAIVLTTPPETTQDALTQLALCHAKLACLADPGENLDHSRLREEVEMGMAAATAFLARRHGGATDAIWRCGLAPGEPALLRQAEGERWARAAGFEESRQAAE